MGALLIASLLVVAHVMAADAPKTAEEYKADPALLLEAYRHVEAASVSDAVEQLLHEKRYMSHHMQAIFPAKFAGRALTVRLAKQENHEADALSGMLKAIDTGAAGSVYVMSVVDGGVRDLPQLKRLGFPVYALGPVPSTSVSHYRFAGANVPVMCDGVQVMPDDIVVADQDGVVVVPKANAAEVLIKAQALDESEHSMYPYIETFHSIEEAVKKFGRI